MPTVARPDVLAAAYDAVTAQVNDRVIPTTVIHAGHTIFRYADVKHLPKPAAGGHVPKAEAALAMLPRDGVDEGKTGLQALHTTCASPLQVEVPLRS